MNARVRMAISLAVVAVLLIAGLLMFMRLAEEPVVRSSVAYGWLREEQFAVVATGNPGSAVGSQDSDGYVRGHIYAFYLDFTSGISTTTDFTLTTKSSPSATILTLTNNYTDTWYYPTVQQTDSSGSGTSTYDRFPTNDQLTASVGQSTATSVVTITLYWGQ